MLACTTMELTEKDTFTSSNWDKYFTGCLKEDIKRKLLLAFEPIYSVIWENVFASYANREAEN